MIDKNGEVIASAVTNLDLHDIARVCCTYGVRRYYLITPLEDQVLLVRRILDHWLTGAGGSYNPKRRQALERVHIQATFAGMLDEVTALHGCRPVVVATTAKRRTESLSYRHLHEMMEDSVPVVLAFGTAWGLSEAFIKEADFILDPLSGSGAYNHLSVRSAVAIILDRLLGR